VVPPRRRTTRALVERGHRAPVAVVQRRFQALPVDDTVAASYGRLAAAVVAAGRRPRPRAVDLLIAATAHAHGARLHTRDPADLAGADELLEVVAV
jgi:toxin FitB